MLLPDMTPTEIRKAMLMDFKEILFRMHNYLPKFRRMVIKKKMRRTPIVQVRKFTTANKVRWWVTIYFQGKGKLKFNPFFGAIYYSNKGFRYVGLDMHQTLLKIYNAHFFHRYNERMNLGLTDVQEICEVFLKRNDDSVVVVDKEEINEGAVRYVAQVPDGLKLGVHNLKEHTVIWNTFISKDLYKGDQAKYKEEALQRLEESMETLTGADKNMYERYVKLLREE